MKNIKTIIVLVFLAVVMHLFSLNQTPEKDNTEFQKTFFEALRKKMLGEYTDAVNLFMKCINLKSDSHASMYELAKISLIVNDPQSALNYSKQASQLDKKNYWYLKILSDCYLYNDNVEKSIKTHKKIIKIEKKRYTEEMLKIAELYIALNKYKKSIKTLNKLENKYGYSEESLFAKYQIHKLLRNDEKTIKMLEKLEDLFPYDKKYSQLIAENYIEQNNLDKAIEFYKKMKEEDPKNELTDVYLVEIYKLQKKYKLALKHLETVARSKSIDDKIKIKVIFPFIKLMGKETEIKPKLREILQVYYDLDNENLKAISLLADYYIKENDYEKAKVFLHKIIDKDKSKYAIWEQILLIYNKENNYKKMEEISDEAIKYFPTKIVLYLFNGVSSMQEKNYNKAIKSLKKGISFIFEEKAKYDFYNYLAECYHSTKQNKLSDENFEKALKIKPDEVFLLNNYAYYLSVRNEKLDKAEQMSKKTIEKEPTNHTYLDTYAWILYMQKDYKKALIYIKKSIDNGGNSSEVIKEHYNKILLEIDN